MMNSIQMLGDDPGVGQFAVGLFRIAHRKSFDGSAPEARHQRGHGARIQPAAKKDSDGHVAHQVTANSTFQEIAVSARVVTLSRTLSSPPTKRSQYCSIRNSPRSSISSQWPGISLRTPR